VTTSSWLIDRIANFEDRPFLAKSEATYSYSDLSQSISEQIEYFKAKGIEAGDVVILHGDYTLKAIASLLALFEIKAMVAPVAIDAESEREQRINASKARWEIYTNESNNLQVEMLGAQTEVHSYIKKLTQANQAGLILFSSGSTGEPKAMIHSAERLLETFQTKRTKNLSILIFLLFDHIGGINTLFNGLSTGALIVVPKNRNPEIVAQAIEQHSVKLLPASPTFLNLFLISGVTDKYNLVSLRYITYGTEPMPESLLNRIKAAFPNTALIQTFGTSETGISQTISRSSSSTLIKFDDPNTEYKIVDSELWLRSKSQILGYLNYEMSRFTDDGWFKTGDLIEPASEKSGEGFFRIIGRKQEIINVGGEKVTPSEVESALLEIPEIADCLVYAEENAIIGQIVAAEIVLKEAIDKNSIKRVIKKYCREKLSAYKVPARIHFKEVTNFSNRFKKMRLK